MDPSLRLHPGQQAFTPAQEAEAQRFVRERIANQLSTEPVDELEAELFLQHVYAMVFLPPPQQIHWVDGPLELVALRAPPQVQASGAGVRANVVKSVGASVQDRVRDSVQNSVQDSVGRSVGIRVAKSVGARLEGKVPARV